MNTLKIKLAGEYNPACYCFLCCQDADLEKLWNLYKEKGHEIFDEGYDFNGLNVDRYCYRGMIGGLKAVTLNGDDITDQIKQRMEDDFYELPSPLAVKPKKAKFGKTCLIFAQEWRNQKDENGMYEGSWEFDFDSDFDPSKLSIQVLKTKCMGCMDIWTDLAYKKQLATRIDVGEGSPDYVRVNGYLNGKFSFYE